MEEDLLKPIDFERHLGFKNDFKEILNNFLRWQIPGCREAEFQREAGKYLEKSGF